MTQEIFSPLQQLQVLSNLTPVEGMWFNEKQLGLDGYSFMNCRFDNCELLVSSINFEIERCYIDDTTTVVYTNEVAKVVRLFNYRPYIPPERESFFTPVINEDGTISIGS